MRTYRQIQASRRNGALSRGPITAAGKARSAHDATTLGLTAQTVVLANESPERFAQLRDQLIARHQPESDEEFECIDADAPVVAKNHAQIDQTTVNMLAFRAIHDADRALAYVHRYECSDRRNYRRALDDLRNLQAGREKQKCEIEPNTPPSERPRTRRKRGPRATA